MFERAWIASILHLPAPAPGLAWSRLETDSRRADSSGLFVALPGETFDGHDFVESALSKGAMGALVRSDFAWKSLAARYPDRVFFPVPDPLVAYRQIAAAWRRRFSIPVIAIAGSVGKTTTKEFLAALLGAKFFPVLRTEASQNGFIGIPLTLLSLKPQHRAAVIEIGIDELGAMKQHLDVVAPTAALISALGPEHLEKLLTVENAVQEELLALQHTVQTRDNLIAVNLDEPALAQWVARRPNGAGKTITYSLSSSADVRGTYTVSQERHWLSLQSHLPTWGQQTFKLECPLPGEHHARNLLGACALATGLGLTPEDLANGIKEFRGAYGRSEIHLLASKNVRTLCDYYNANPTSVVSALNVLPTLTSTGRMHVVLGDMLELGTHELQFHANLAPDLEKLKPVSVLLWGERMKSLAERLAQGPLAKVSRHFTEKREIEKSLQTALQPGDALLIKGSRGMKMEEVWKWLNE